MMFALQTRIVTLRTSPITSIASGIGLEQKLPGLLRTRRSTITLLEQVKINECMNNKYLIETSGDWMRNSRPHLENVINSGVRGRTSSPSVFSCFLRSALSYSMEMLTTSSITLEWNLWYLKSAVITVNLLTNPRSTTC